MGCAAGWRAQDKVRCCLRLQCWTFNSAAHWALLLPAGSGIPRALWEAGGSKHWKQSQTFLNSLAKNFWLSELVKCNFLCITSSFALPSCRKITCMIWLYIHTPKTTQMPCANQLEISKGQWRTKNNRNNRMSYTLVCDVKKRCLLGDEAQVVWVLSLSGQL